MPLSVDQIAAKANDIATSTLVPMRQQKNYAVALLELVNRRISPDDAAAVFIHLTISALGRKDKSDIVLASWGLIRGYESKDLIVKERRLKYIEDSGYKSSTDNLAKEEIKYYRTVAQFAIRLAENEKDWQAFVKEAVDKYSGDNLPVLHFLEVESDRAANITKRPENIEAEKSAQKAEYTKGQNQNMQEDESPQEPEGLSLLNADSATPVPKLKPKKRKKESKLERVQRRCAKSKLRGPYTKGEKIGIALGLIVVLVFLIIFSIESQKTIDSITAGFLSQNDAVLDVEDDLLVQFRHDIISQVREDTDMTKLEEQANAGDLEARYLLGCAYSSKYRDDEAEKQFLLAAEGGYAPAQAALSYLYICGYVVPKDKTDGYDYATKAAEQGNDTGQYLLGHCYQHGIGTNIDYKAAAQWYQLAAEQDNVLGKRGLGTLYLAGEGVPQDYKVAALLFESAYTDGDIFSAYLIGRMYEKGMWFDKNIKTALEWYLRAAEGGVAHAWTVRGYYFHTGEGVDQDYDEAFRCYTNAAKQGDSDGQAFLGLMYLNGTGVEQNSEVGLDWMSKSAEQGNKEAIQFLEEMLQKLPIE
ncbi:tetratricopeptide repeat protein [Congzhengia minquanensis]|uniref:Sel1 repeat family protein n=1 Tax=Congzhengia minquanensis TaxID=2763657 RepID=A0A926HY60_9FIRM|nr:tetratricopeptide repeat protein [Congzhengia minquanensis]MBC8540078.1 sel1 repeat family protein [Congzhengia minquanensis]